MNEFIVNFPTCGCAMHTNQGELPLKTPSLPFNPPVRKRPTANHSGPGEPPLPIPFLDFENRDNDFVEDESGLCQQPEFRELPLTVPRMNFA